MVSTIRDCDDILFPSFFSLKLLRKICVTQFWVGEDIKALHDFKWQDQAVNNTKKKNQNKKTKKL